MPDNDQGQAPTDPAAQDAAGTTTTPQQQPDAAPAAGDLAALPEWAQLVIKDLRKEQAARRRQAADAAEAARVADEKRMAEQQQWQQLAEQRASEIAALKPVADRYSVLADEITAALEAEIKAWPAEVLALRPPDADAPALMAWAKTARPLAAKLTAAGQTPAPGHGGMPKPTGQGSKADADRMRAAQMQVRSRF